MSFVPHSEADRREMLRRIGVPDVQSLFGRVPEEVLREGTPDLPEPLSEWEAVRRVGELAAESESLVCFAGGGIYDHHVPAAVDHLIRRSEFYTAYTPYQAEVAQGTLQAIYEFQTMICELTGMEVANASIYDGATATGEAALMAMRVAGRDRVVLADSLHPHYRKVTGTYVSGTASEVARVPPGPDGRMSPAAVADAMDGETACLVVQSPNFFGGLEELDELADIAHEAGALLVAVTEPVSLALVRPPGEAGADIVTGEGQPLGNAMGYGGPVLGLFATLEDFVRDLPGRLAGATEDAEGRRGYVLTLQTREQQIRRERATSNICTNQGLNALAATVYLATVGRDGLRGVAEASARNAHHAWERLDALEGVEPMYPDAPFVREFAVRTEEDSRSVVSRAIDRGLLVGPSLSRFPDLDVPDGLLLAFTEKRDRAEIDRLLDVLAG